MVDWIQKLQDMPEMLTAGKEREDHDNVDSQDCYPSDESST